MTTPATPRARYPASSAGRELPSKPSMNRASTESRARVLGWAGEFICYDSRGAQNFAATKRLTGEGDQVKVRIESRAPTRIDLAGGTLDIWPLYLFHEGAVTVNCAITRYASCVIQTAAESSRRIVLVSRDTRRRESFASLEALNRTRQYKLPLL